MVNRAWGSTHGHSYPDSKGVPRERVRGLGQTARKTVKRRQIKKRRARNNVTPDTHE